MKILTLSAKVENLQQVLAFVEGELEARDCPPSIQMQIVLAVEELYVNIASYAYPEGEGEAEIRCDVLEDPLRAVIQFRDRGIPYDPVSKEDADTSPEALMNRVGGLGILLVKKTMDEMRYAYEDGQNVLTIVKKLG